MYKLFLLIFVIVFCFNSNAQTKKHYELIETTEKDYLKAKSLNIGLKIKKGRKIEKENYIMTLPIEGDTIFLRDNLVKEESPYITEFKYLGEFTELNKYIVEVIYINDSKIWLIDKNNGTITAVSPYFIVNSEILISYNDPQEYYKNVNIYTNDVHCFKVLDSIKERPHQIVDDIVLASNSSFIIKVRKYYLDKDNIEAYFKNTTEGYYKVNILK
ncbi:MAG: hypothetical protein LBM25_00785 [Bacteroidales bacterium]|jgi:hypothetical protein|nr:hypothetical protein [Bacteroidales bacterium]